MMLTGALGLDIPFNPNSVRKKAVDLPMDLVTIPIEASFFESQDCTQVAWLGMAGAIINTRGQIILVDPLLSMLDPSAMVGEAGYRLKLPPPIDAQLIPRVDLVLYTHGDDDHFGSLTARRLARRLSCQFVAPAPVARSLAQLGIPPNRIRTAEDHNTLTFDQTTVTVTPALHDWQAENPWQRGECCGYIIRTPDGAIWHPGDSRLIDELFAVRDIDVMFFDIAGIDSHLGPQGSARLAVSCGAKRLIAYHYGTFDLPPGSFGSCDPQDALPYLNGLSASFLQLNPGQPLRLPLEE